MTYYPAGGTTSSLADNPKYAEYRFYEKGGYDEELQVWSWTDSYATQYRDVTNSGTAPVHQAWSFGGNYTPIASLPTTNAYVTYNGSWTGTAQTTGWIDTIDPTQTVSYNNNWQVSGTSALRVNFGLPTNNFNGTLTPTQWIGVNKNNQLQAVIPGDGTVNSLVPFITTPGTTTAPNIVLAGTLATSTKAGTPSNQITGSAVMDPATGWISTSTSNPLLAGVFGANATEVAGVFALSSANPNPYGGKTSINNDTRGFITMSGMFHGQ
jgi:hypothetical protein